MNTVVHDARGGSIAAWRRSPVGHKDSQSIALGILLVLVAAGYLWENVLFFRLAGFPVSLTIILMIGVYLLGVRSWLKPRRASVRLAVPAVVLVLFELIVHGIFGDGISDTQWPRSFGLLAMCAGVVVISNNFSLSADRLPLFARFVSWVTYFAGGLGVIQFILANGLGYYWQPLPEFLAAGGADPENDLLRFGGLMRSRGISTEFSYYGIGMAVLVSLCLMLLLLLYPTNRKSLLFRIGAVLAGLGGLGTSVSLTGWGLLLIFLGSWALGNPGILLRRMNLCLIIVIAALGVGQFVWPFLQTRVSSILSQTDSSANYRVLASVDLILSPSDDLGLSLLGTGAGKVDSNPGLENTFLRYVSAPYLAWLMQNRERFVIVSGWAYIVVALGWVGLAINGWLLATALWRRRNRRVPIIVPAALLVGYLFASGDYLSPEWWALLVLLSGFVRGSD